MNRGTTKKIAISAIMTLVVVLLAFFVYRTSLSYFSGPSITINEPTDYEAFSTSTVTIAGIADRIEDISLDGRPITIDDTGKFSETILLMPGYNIETMVAHDRFGHSTQKRLELVYLAPKSNKPTTTFAPVISTTTANTATSS